MRTQTTRGNAALRSADTSDPRQGALTRACCALLLSCSVLAGCKAAPAPTSHPPVAATKVIYPARPAVVPPPMKLFHQTDTSLTLVTKQNASDEEVIAILYQLHDAARAHTFDALHLPQTFIDARKPIVWFHIYRGAQCASEKYAEKLPCGASYHAAGDYTLGSYTNRDWDDAELLHADGSETQLWNPEKP
jgi:hypothetical protein